MTIAEWKVLAEVVIALIIIQWTAALCLFKHHDVWCPAKKQRPAGRKYIFVCARPFLNGRPGPAMQAILERAASMVLNTPGDVRVVLVRGGNGFCYEALLARRFLTEVLGLALERVCTPKYKKWGSWAWSLPAEVRAWQDFEPSEDDVVLCDTSNWALVQAHIFLCHPCPLRLQAVPMKPQPWDRVRWIRFLLDPLHLLRVVEPPLRYRWLGR